ncbi:hypothetical protein HZS_7695, partial [Henneguya salminicola]
MNDEEDVNKSHKEARDTQQGPFRKFKRSTEMLEADDKC